MASTISSPDVPTSNGRLFYCHQCSHQWRKTENSEYLCPQCREGFIEEVDDANTSQGESNSDPIFSILHRIMSDISPSSRRAPRAQGSTSRSTARSRSRSPRMSFYIGSSDRDGQSGSNSMPAHRLSRGFSQRAFHFDLDDLMSTFLSTRSPPVSQRTLQEIPTLTITQEQTDTQCSICFDEFKLAESEVRKLPCNHMFHERCIFPWLRINGTCPVCRARLSRSNDDDASNSDASPSVSSFDNILRFMRLRRHARSRNNEATTSSSSAQTEPPAPAAPSDSHRRRRNTSLLIAHDRARVDSLRPQRIQSNIEVPNPLRSSEARLRRLRNRLAAAYRRSTPQPPSSLSVIDLTSSDTEPSIISRVSRPNEISESSSSSSGQRLVSSSSSDSSLSFVSSAGSDSDDIRIPSQTLLLSPFRSSSSDEE